MGAVYANVSDIQAIGKSLTAQQMESAEVLLVQASAKLRTIAKKYGNDLDSMIAEDEDFGFAVKIAVIQAICRAWMPSISSPTAHRRPKPSGHIVSRWLIPMPDNRCIS